jgi:CsoR family transcriptional regulator, copper-sensing transcriptional repressor
MKHGPDQKTKKLIAIKKTRSLIDKIAQMVEKDEYCIDIMQQNLAAIGLMRNLHKTLMEDHLSHCVKKAIVSKDDKRQQQMIQEIMTVTNLFNK